MDCSERPWKLLDGREGVVWFTPGERAGEYVTHVRPLTPEETIAKYTLDPDDL